MEEVVCPVFHEYVVPPFAVSVVESPMQIVVFPVIEAVIPEFTVIVILAVSAQVPEETITE
jgi:hypothetical protein